MKKIFIISSVRDADDSFKRNLENYVSHLEKQNHIVHLPHRDTNQKNSGYQICLDNTKAITLADEVHIFYNSKSQGSHFDMGVAFALGKKIVVVENETLTEDKSFQNMLVEWSGKY